MDDEYYKERIALLEEEIEVLKEQVKMMTNGGDTNVWPKAFFGMTSKEAALFSILMHHDQLSKEQLMTRLYAIDADDPPDTKIVDVYVCKMRKKLKLYGVKINTLWGTGYRIPQESKELVRKLQEEMEEAA